LVFTAFLLDVQHKKGIVRPASSLVVALNKTNLYLCVVRLVVTGGKTEKEFFAARLIITSAFTCHKDKDGTK